MNTAKAFISGIAGLYLNELQTAIDELQHIQRKYKYIRVNLATLNAITKGTSCAIIFLILWGRSHRTNVLLAQLFIRSHFTSRRDCFFIHRTGTPTTYSLCLEDYGDQSNEIMSVKMLENLLSHTKKCGIKKIKISPWTSRSEQPR